jgi:WD40 repeat protein
MSLNGNHGTNRATGCADNLFAVWQVEPLADWHVGAITGVAAAATGAHIISCGMDGSIRVWAAAAGGQLVSKRDVGGQLTCSAASTPADGSLLAVGSKAGVLR